MSQNDFERTLNRSLVAGGLGCFLPFYLLLQRFGVSQLERWHIYVLAIILIIGLGVINKARELNCSVELSSLARKKLMLWLKFLSVVASFLVGSILSFGFSVTILLFFRSA